MSKWEKVALKHIGEIVTGNTPSTKIDDYYNSNDIPFYKPNDISNTEVSKLNIATSYISETARSCARIIPCNSILVTCIGIIGKTAITTTECSCNQQINAIIPYKDLANSLYLAYAIMSKKTYMQDTANAPIVPIINKTKFASIEIPLPPLKEQHKIASILDTVSEALKLRKQQLNELDLLVKSKFVEMFGDPVVNSKKLPTTELINIVKLQRGYDLPTQSRNSQGNIPVYGSNGILDYHNEAKTINGIITGRSGTIGKVYYCFDKYWPLNTTLFSIDTYGNNILYLSLLLQYFKLERFYSGTGVPTLNRNIIHKEQIIVVSIKEQNKFASFVQYVDELKSEVQKSINQLQTLFDSLMQQYFE